MSSRTPLAFVLRALRYRPTLLSLGVAGTFVTLVAAFTEYRNVFEFDPDESNNLIKTLLIDRGFSLGREIWTDQPPLFTVLLGPWLHLSGWSVANARSLVLLFSGLLVFALFDAMRLIGGRGHGFVAVSLLIVSASYVPLSVSVMIGLPSVALLAASLWSLIRAVRTAPTRIKSRAGWQGVSGAALGLSLTTKLFTAFLAPPLALLVLGLAGWRLKQRERGAWLDVTCFFSALVTTLLCGAWPLLRAGTWSGLIETHSSLRESRGGAFDGLGTIGQFCSNDWPLYALAVAGVVSGIVQRRHLLWLYTVWLALGVASLADHYPVWPHHRLLLSVPASALAGFGVGAVVSAARKLAQKRLSSRLMPFVAASAGLLLGAPATCVVMLHPDRWEQAIHPPNWSSDSKDWAIYDKFAFYAADASMVAAARPIHAFRAGRPLPPQLAVTSWKRFRQGELTSRDVYKQFGRYHPQVVLLTSRWPAKVRRDVTRRMTKTHCRVFRWSHQSTELWVERNLAKRLEHMVPARDAARCR